MFYDFITKNTDIFCGKHERSFCTAKASHIVSTKNVGILQILTFDILTKRTDDIVSFERLVIRMVGQLEAFLRCHKHAVQSLRK